MEKNLRILAIGLPAIVGFVPYVWGAEVLVSPDTEFDKLSWSLEEPSGWGSGILAETWKGGVLSFPRESPAAWRAGEANVRPLRVSTRIAVTSRRYGTLFGYVGIPGEPAFGTRIYEHALFEEEVRSGAREHWLDPAGSSDETVTAGYAWRGMKIEGSAFRSHSVDSGTETGMPFKPFGLTSGRLSFRSDGNWTLQVSRRRSNRLDEIEGTDSGRRTTVSAAYRRLWNASEWKTTFAAGHISSGDGKSPGQAFLCESVLTLRHAHTLFTRWERAAAADIFNQDERLRDQDFRAEKLTFGYVYDIAVGSESRLDIGVIGSRGVALSERNDLFSENRKSYKVFTRLTMPY